MDFPSLDLRLHRYRVRSGDGVGDLLARLRQDPRVRSAQTAVVYRVPEPEKPPIPATRSRTAPAPTQQAKTPASLQRPSKRNVTAAKAASRKGTAGEASGTAPPSSPRAERPPAPVTQTALRFPTADEPFVNRGGR